MIKQKITCIQCPLGCQITVIKKDKELKISGFECKKGEEYAKNEVIDPKRIVTTTVFIENGIYPMLPVRSDKEIPKNLIRKSVVELAKINVIAPVKTGDIIYKNILDTGVNIIASRDMDIHEK